MPSIISAENEKAVIGGRYLELYQLLSGGIHEYHQVAVTGQEMMI
jgi:hypothetical protein